MTKEDIVRMAQEAGWKNLKNFDSEMQEFILMGNFKDLEVFAALVASAERPWVGLTDEEIQYCVELKNPEAIAEEVEAKLKEKNT